MPHDKNHKLIQPGDKVTIEATVVSVTDADGYCNATVITDEPMYPTTAGTTIVLNAKQLLKHEAAA